MAVEPYTGVTSEEVDVVLQEQAIIRGNRGQGC